MSYRLLRKGVLRLADNQVIAPRAAGWDDYVAWTKAGNVPEPMAPIPPAAPTLAELQKRRIHAITREAEARAQAVFPGITLPTLVVMRELWLSVAPAARQPTARLTTLIDLYLAWKTAAGQIKACTTPDCIAAVTPSWP